MEKVPAELDSMVITQSIRYTVKRRCIVNARGYSQQKKPGYMSAHRSGTKCDRKV